MGHLGRTQMACKLAEDNLDGLLLCLKFNICHKPDRILARSGFLPDPESC